MKPQSPEGEALLARYRQEHALPEAVRARARDALARHIAAGAPGNTPDVAWPVPSAPRNLRWIWLSAGTASLLALIVLVASRSAPPPPRDPQAAAVTPHAATQRAASEGPAAPSRSGTSPEPSGRANAPAVAPAAGEAGRAWVDRSTQPRAAQVPSSNAREPRSARSPASLRTADARRAPPPNPSAPSAPAEKPAPTSAPPSVRAETQPNSLPAVPELARSAPEQPRQESLDVEVQLLRSAHDRLSAGQPLNALSILTEHARRFPNGQLRDMREVSRVIALCELGRVTEARERASGFLQEQPRSHYATRLRGSCAAERE